MQTKTIDTNHYFESTWLLIFAVTSLVFSQWLLFFFIFFPFNVRALTFSQSYNLFFFFLLVSYEIGLDSIVLNAFFLFIFKPPVSINDL